jgi:hypothetical protein
MDRRGELVVVADEIVETAIVSIDKKVERKQATKKLAQFLWSVVS